MRWANARGQTRKLRKTIPSYDPESEGYPHRSKLLNIHSHDAIAIRKVAFGVSP